MATKNNISILGCGWLGLPLAKTLSAHGFNIKGSTTSPSRLPLLADAGLQPYLLRLENDAISGDVQDFLRSSSTLIVDFPPKVHADPSASYSQKIRNLIPHIVEAGIKYVLFISSTSVYGDESGIVSEETLARPTTKSGQQLLESEDLFQQEFAFETTVIRFGGLIANDRHPIHSLSGKENLENPEAPINLIHREDCLSIIIKIIENKIWGEIFNAVAPYHPTREAYYMEKARTMGLALPGFSRKSNGAGKQVSSAKLLRLTNYNFLHPEL